MPNIENHETSTMTVDHWLLLDGTPGSTSLADSGRSATTEAPSDA